MDKARQRENNHHHRMLPSWHPLITSSRIFRSGVMKFSVFINEFTPHTVHDIESIQLQFNDGADDDDVGVFIFHPFLSSIKFMDEILSTGVFKTFLHVQSNFMV
jgi:hypothetical protein